MKKLHRRAGWLVAGLLGLSLMMAARGAEAYGPFRWPEPGPPEMGDPDQPNGSPFIKKPAYVYFDSRFILVMKAPKPMGASAPSGARRQTNRTARR